MLTFGSLFAGIGGFDLGFERAGMVCKWQVEINEYRRKVLTKHWPDVRRYVDARECGGHNLEAVDVICGGFPCQPHSLAGKREGATDDRNLWPEYRRIIAELQPAWVVAENVFGIVSTMLDTVLSDLEDLDYATISLIVPACAFDAPHRRDRVFVVAHAIGAGLEKWQGITGDIEQEFQAVERSGNSNGVGIMAYTQKQPQRAGLCQDQQTKEWGRRSGNGSSKGRRVWQPEPRVGRVADGVPHRVDRIAALGDAVIPQASEWIGQRLVAAAGGVEERG
jgi:DNA (cytosine-5)-methyltransferase 1